MDWVQSLIEVIKALGEYGTPLVITGVVIVGAVALAIVVYRGIVAVAGWARGHIDRWVEKKEERDERQAAAMESLVQTARATHETQERQTEIMVRMDRDCKERHDETHKRLGRIETQLDVKSDT